MSHLKSAKISDTLLLISDVRESMRCSATTAKAHKQVYYDVLTKSQDALAQSRALLAKPRDWPVNWV